MRNLQGSIVALITPFDKELNIDFNALGRLIDFHLENGTEAIVVNGTTGESPTITLDEFDALTKFAVKRVNGQIPVIAGTGSNNTDQAIAKSCIAEYNGASGLLVVTPYYNKPTSKGLKTYFRSIAEATKLPIIMYNVPGRSGVNMSIDLIIDLAKSYPNIQGIKEASGSLDRIMDLIQNRPKGFSVYSGDDHLALSTVLMGGDGCISVVANQIPKVFCQMLSSALNGEVELSRSLHYKYLDLMKVNFVETNPIPVKTSLYHMGWSDLNFRSPMCTMEEENEERLLSVLNKLGLLEEVKEKVFG
jgi:4-hydroxy-tetrahydrodipicolinate synthase